MSFNVRVYGVWIEKDRGVLVSDELIRGVNFVKFPGGGLEYGEGTRDCLKREFMEEMNLRIEVREHLYTTDFFQESAFRPNDQIISVYYYVKPTQEIKIPLLHHEEAIAQFAKQPHADQETFRFIPFNRFSPDELSLPIDKVVAELIQQRYVH